MAKKQASRLKTSIKYFKALWLSIALHAFLLIGLLAGDFSSTPKPKPVLANNAGEPIKAVVIDKAKLEQAINNIKKQKIDQRDAEKKRLNVVEKRALDAKKRRNKEEARIKKLEQQRKKKEQEKIKSDKAAKSSQIKAAKAEKIRKQKEQEKQIAEKAAAVAKSNRLKEEAKAKKAKEAETLRLNKIAERKRKDIAAKEQAMKDAMLAQQMADEMASRNQARNKQVMTETQRYSALITQSINQRMIKDRSTMENKSCRLNLTLAPSGFVINVNVGQGDKVVCDAANIAIGKAGNLPVSKDPDVFKKMRNIAVTVIPDF